MLNNSKKGDRVELQNGLKATITAVDSRWGTTTFSIKPDGGAYRTRKYNADGVTEDGRSFNVKSLLAGSAAKTVSTFKKQLADFKKDFEDAFAVLSEGIEDMQATAAAPVAAALTKYDFGDGRGEVAAKRHMNPQGDEGGIVAATARVSADSRIGRGSVVFGNAVVTGGSKIIDNSRIYGNAQVHAKTLRGVDVNGTEMRAIAAA